MSFQGLSQHGEAPLLKQWVNHRATVRYQCAPAFVGRLLVAGDQEYQRGWLQDLSLGGLGILLRRALPVRVPVVIRLKSSTSDKTYDLPARVVHSTQLANGDYLVGCEFVQSLTNEDLDQLL